jgi:hypothetical protein
MLRTETSVCGTEQREFDRYPIALSGKIFLPAEDASFDCQVVNLSGGGAGIQCNEPPPLRSFVILYIDGIGRFKALTTRYVDGELGLQFITSEEKREQLLKDILYFVMHGTKITTRTRRHTRSTDVKWSHFLRPNGDCVRCEALDLSLQGISLKTKVQPPIGEITRLGRVYGRVVRHHDDGIAVQFLEPNARPFDEVYGDVD